MRQIALLLIPAAAAIARARDADRRGSSTSAASSTPSRPTLVAEALFWFSFCLPFSGVNLLLTRTFFCLQRPWMPTALAVGSLVVNVVVSLALYEPFGIGGVVIGTAVANVVHDGRCRRVGLRRELGGARGGADAARGGDRCWSRAALLGGVAYGVWCGLDERARPLAARRRSSRSAPRSPPAALVYAAVVLRAAASRRRAQIVEPVRAAGCGRSAS